jgi:signal transduction histidine kinase
MAKEVSCRAVAHLLDVIKAKEIPQEVLLKGIPYSLEYLQKKHERIEWEVYCQFLKNLRPIFNDEEFFEFGQAWIKSKFFLPWAILLRLLLNLGKSLPLAQNRIEQLASQFFAAINFRFERVGPNGLKVTLKIKDKYEFCPEHFLIVKGSLSVIPAIRGYRDAQVTMKWIDRGATFEVTESKKTKVHSWFYKKIFWLFTARATINEIIEAHNALILRYQELEKARQELANLSQKLIDLREQERQRIANELHDDIGGNLSSIALLGEVLANKLSLLEKERKQLQEIPRIARVTAESMHDIIWFINPENDSMDRLVVKMRETANLMLDQANFTFDAPSRRFSFEVDASFRRNLYLIYKEILQNIIKHAQATQVAIAIEETGSLLQLRVADNGVGFNTELKYHGTGLKNLKRRTKEMGGTITISSRTGGGTLITFKTKIP